METGIYSAENALNLPWELRERLHNYRRDLSFCVYDKTSVEECAQKLIFLLTIYVLQDE